MKAIENAKMLWRTADFKLISVKPQLGGPADPVSRPIPACGEREDSKLCHTVVYTHFSSNAIASSEAKSACLTMESSAMYVYSRLWWKNWNGFLGRVSKYREPFPDNHLENAKREAAEWEYLAHRADTKKGERGLAGNGKLLNTIKQTLSDVCSARRIAAGDC